MRARIETASDLQPEQAPRDGMGPGYLVYRLASDFHALCCLCGPEQARQELAEIILSEFSRGDRNVQRP